jgi:hypothetical protein
VPGSTERRFGIAAAARVTLLTVGCVAREQMNGQLVLDPQHQRTGSLGWGEVQIGGPTWICPPQDQTMYFWDIVIWQPR